MKEYLYTNKDGRIRMVIQKDDGTITSKSYPRVLMEKELGRELEPYEEVHHIDGDKTNNNLSNLKVINRTDHRKYHATKYKDCIAKCEVCGKDFIWTAEVQSRYYNDLSRKSVPKNRSITCSKHCAGILSHKTYLKNAGVPEWNREQT